MGHMIDMSPQPGTISLSSTVPNKSKASPKVARSPKQSQKGAGKKSTKTPKPKKIGAKKGVTPTQQTGGVAIIPSKPSLVTGGGNKHMLDPYTSELPMLFTSQPSDDDMTDPPSSPEPSTTNYVNFSSSYMKKYNLGEETTPTIPPTQWLLGADDSDSNMSDP